MTEENVQESGVSIAEVTKKQPAAISDSRKNEDGTYSSKVSLWVHKAKDGRPFLTGYINHNGTSLKVIGNFRKLGSKADQMTENSPVLAFRQDLGRGEDGKNQYGDWLNDVVAWPQNERKDGKEVDFRTLTFKIGEDTTYARVYDEIGEAREHLGFTGEAKVYEAKADAPEADAPEADDEAPKSSGPKMG